MRNIKLMGMNEFLSMGNEADEAKETKATEEFMELINYVMNHDVMKHGLMSDGRGDDNE